MSFIYLQIICLWSLYNMISNLTIYLWSFDNNAVTVTRLIRTSFGDYQLQTIPPGMALEVPLKELKKQLHKGPLFKKNAQKKAKKQQKQQGEEEASPVKWVRHYR